MSTKFNRIASAWVTRVANKQYDLIVRLQVLEGVAGQPHGVWYNKGNQGLNQAIKALGDGHKIDPQWFSTSDTGMFNHLETTLNILLNKFKPYNKIRVDKSMALDFIHNIVMGFGFKGTGDSSPVLYELGKWLKDKILAGKETPRTVINAASHFLTLKLVNLTKLQDFHGHFTHDDPDDKDLKEVSEHELPGYHKKSATEVLLEAIKDHNDPLGKQMRANIRESVDKHTALGQMINSWVDHLEKTGDFPGKGDMAKQMGIAAGTLSTYWRIAWEKILKHIWNDKHLLKNLEERYTKQGVVFDLQKPHDLESMWKNFR